MSSSENSTDKLEVKGIDYFSSFAKSLVGAAPFVGTFLSEIISKVIPNQRVERIVDFARKLDQKIDHLEEKFIQNEIKNPAFNDLVEEGIRQSTRAISEERREYISSIISNSLTNEDISYIESKHLMRMLGELNDIEIIWLRFHAYPYLGGDNEFREKHKNIIDIEPAAIGSSQDVLDKNTLKDSYKNHLAELSLLNKQYKIDRKTDRPEIDSAKKTFKIKGYKITNQGKLLLREIDLLPEEAT